MWEVQCERTSTTLDQVARDKDKVGADEPDLGNDNEKEDNEPDGLAV